MPAHGDTGQGIKRLYASKFLLSEKKFPSKNLITLQILEFNYFLYSYLLRSFSAQFILLRTKNNLIFTFSERLLLSFYNGGFA